MDENHWPFWLTAQTKRKARKTFKKEPISQEHVADNYDVTDTDRLIINYKQPYLICLDPSDFMISHNFSIIWKFQKVEWQGQPYVVPVPKPTYFCQRRHSIEQYPIMLFRGILWHLTYLMMQNMASSTKKEMFPNF